MPRRENLTPAEARRAVLAAQGFRAREPGADARAVLAQVRRLGAVQIDSVNVLCRAHYLPAFSRLGAYDRDILDRSAAVAPRRLFEYWGHEASVLPVTTQPLLRWRMTEPHAWSSVARTAERESALAVDVLACLAAHGPATSARIEEVLQHSAARTSGNWGWNWSVVKQVVEHLFWTGEISTAGRDRQFRRRYALTEAVLPATVLATPTPSREDAMAALVEIAARALGVATAADLRDWFRLPAADTQQAIERLAAAGDLTEVRIPGWPTTWRHRTATVPRGAGCDALLVPFDPLIWRRERVERLFGMRYRLEIYTPAARREFGYYVLPFLQGDHLAARVDLKADRATGRLLCLAAWAHEADAETPERLAAALGALAGWLGVPEVAVRPVGDLGDAVAAAAKSRSGNSPRGPRGARGTAPVPR